MSNEYDVTVLVKINSRNLLEITVSDEIAPPTLELDYNEAQQLMFGLRSVLYRDQKESLVTVEGWRKPDCVAVAIPQSNEVKPQSVKAVPIRAIHTSNVKAPEYEDGMVNPDSLKELDGDLK